MLDGMNIESGMRLARTFYEAGMSLAQTSVSPEGVGDSVVEKVVAGTANLAFSCELAMKLMLFRTDRWHRAEKTHDLQQLFGLLDEPVRRSIEDLTIAFYTSRSKQEYGHDRFIADLEASRDAFVNLRYWHELPKSGKGKFARPLFMCCLGQAMMLWLDILVPL